MDLAIAYAAGVVTMLVLTDYGSEDAQFLGCILALCWVGSNVAYQADFIHAAMCTDLAVACASYWVWKNNQIGWRTAFFALSVYQLIADAVFDLASWGFYEQWARASNAIFMLQLIALSYEGGRHVWGGFVDRIRSLRARRWATQKA